MLPANIVNALQAFSRSDRTLIAAATDTPNPTTKLAPGQQVEATVQTKISEGLFKVQVAGQTLQMRLPGTIQSGEVLKLAVITTQPKITFSIVASTSPLATPDKIGTTAQLLSNLAELPMERRTVQHLGSKAVWPAEHQPPEAKLLAGALREALGKSGLFYESHQAQWIRGERSTDQLLEEPQNILTGKSLLQPGSEAKAATGRTSATDSSAEPAQATPARPTVSGQVEKSAQAGPSNQGLASQDKVPAIQSSSPTTAQPADDAPLTITRELLPLVQQQLHTLEHHHLVWAGQVWPGQQMQWEIQGEAENEARQKNERKWSTEIELALPRLGGVHARLILAGDGLRLALNVNDPTTVALFNRALPMLKAALAEVDIPLAAAVVEKT